LIIHIQYNSWGFGVLGFWGFDSICELIARGLVVLGFKKPLFPRFLLVFLSPVTFYLLFLFLPIELFYWNEDFVPVEWIETYEVNLSERWDFRPLSSMCDIL